MGIRLNNTAIAVLILAATATAHAESGFYVGADVGSTTQHVTDTPYHAPDQSFDASSANLGLFAGYQFNPYVALELGYQDLGKVSGGNGSLHAKATSTQYGVLLSYPFGNGFSVYGRLGGASTSVHLDADNTVGGNASQTSNTIMSGVGVRYALDRNVDMRLEYIRLPNGALDDMFSFLEQVHTSYDTVQVGVSYRF